MIGFIAYQCGGRQLECQVLVSSDGSYCIGTADEDGAFSQESVEFYDTRELAEDVLDRGDWTPRDCTPSNMKMFEPGVKLKAITESTAPTWLNV